MLRRAPPPPVALGARALRALRERLAALGFDEATVAARLGIRSLAALGTVGQLGPRARDPLALLCRLFLLDERVPLPALADALGARALSTLERMGLVELSGAHASCPFNLFPCAGLYVVTDKRGLHLGWNQVMWLYPECFWLARLVPRRPVRCALDLCTGSGLFALLARRHAERVVGVDTNPRALAFARLNAALNGLDGVELLRGDLYGALAELPRAERRFGSILANPPYHPVLESRPGDNAYSGGPSGEGVLEPLVRGLREHLRQGGHAQIITLFAERTDRDWSSTLRRWLGRRGHGFERVRLSTPVGYPSGLARELSRLGRQSQAALARSLRAQRIGGFSFGVLAFQRVRGPGFHAEGRFRPEAPLDLDSHLRRLSRSGRRRLEPPAGAC